MKTSLSVSCRENRVEDPASSLVEIKVGGHEMKCHVTRCQDQNTHNYTNPLSMHLGRQQLKQNKNNSTTQCTVLTCKYIINLHFNKNYILAQEHTILRMYSVMLY